MRLTAYTDYSLRTLMHLGINRDQLVTIQNIADIHGISKNHLMKVVHQLGLSGVVETVRGRHGGLKLKKNPADINLGQVVRSTETDFFMAECFDRNSQGCLYAPSCMLKNVLGSATNAYLAVLDAVTLEDLIRNNPGSKNRGGESRPIKLPASKRKKQ